jgi:two-component system, OmpR family, response regulator
MRVLYVDDDRGNSLIFSEVCRSAGGIDVQTAADGAEAVELVSQWTPDLLVIDLHLPDTDGYALLRRLRERLPDAPAVLCTAEDTPRVEAPARAAGFDACWSKPVNVPELMAQLNRLRPGPR